MVNKLPFRTNLFFGTIEYQRVRDHDFYFRFCSLRLYCLFSGHDVRHDKFMSNLERIISNLVISNLKLIKFPNDIFLRSFRLQLLIDMIYKLR